VRLVLLAWVCLLVGACGLAKPPFTLHDRQDAVEVDVRTLGEYPTSVSRIEVAEEESGRIVWQVLPEGDFFQIHSFELRKGANAADLLDLFWGDVRIAVPRDEPSFLLAPDTEYEVEVCGGEWLKRCAAGTFQFHG
jgi:hypothetical protein